MPTVLNHLQVREKTFSNLLWEEQVTTSLKRLKTEQAVYRRPHPLGNAPALRVPRHCVNVEGGQRNALFGKWDQIREESFSVVTTEQRNRSQAVASLLGQRTSKILKM